MKYLLYTLEGKKFDLDTKNMKNYRFYFLDGTCMDRTNVLYLDKRYRHWYDWMFFTPKQWLVVSESHSREWIDRVQCYKYEEVA